MNQRTDKSKIGSEYLKTLERLCQIVHEQTVALQQKDWQLLNILYGKKENIFLTLQMLQRGAANEKQIIDQDKVKNNRKNTIRHELDLNKVRDVIARVQEIERKNAALLFTRMAEVQAEFVELNRQRQLSKFYLEPMKMQERTEQLNLIS